jgi:DHA2 family multidrug resistance protein
VVDLQLFTRRNFWVGTLALSLGYGTFFGNIVLLPLWLQQYMGYTATWAGMIMAPIGLLALILTPLVGKTTQKVDPRIYATIAFVVFAVVLWMRSRFNTSADLMTLTIPTIVQGISMAFFFIPLVTLTLSGLSPERIPAASGLSNFARITAGAFGTSITTTLWENRAALHHSQLVESINIASLPTNQTLSQLSALGLSREQSLTYLNRLVDQQAFMLSASDIFAASAALFLALIVIVWMAKPVTGAATDAGGAH